MTWAAVVKPLEANISKLLIPLTSYNVYYVKLIYPRYPPGILAVEGFQRSPYILWISG